MMRAFIDGSGNAFRIEIAATNSVRLLTDLLELSQAATTFRLPNLSAQFGVAADICELIPAKKHRFSGYY
jgi:hypothetical protein